MPETLGVSMSRVGGRRKTGGSQGLSTKTAAAFEALYQAFFVRLVQYATWHLRLTKEDACEVVQEAFLLALVKLDVEGNAGPWLYRTVENLALNLRRKTGRRARLMAQFAGTEEEKTTPMEGDESSH